MGEFAAPYNSFWASPSSENRWVFQLPIVRLPFAVHSMVPLFFIIGGYAMAHSVLARSSGGEGAFSRYFQLTLMRRWLRLYLPIIPITVLANAAYFVGVTTRPLAEHARHEWSVIGSRVLFPRRATASRARLVGLAKTILLLGGLYLMCFEGDEGTGVAHVVVRAGYQSLGGLMVISVIATSPSVARRLEAPVLQYLGKISFSWYLVHQLPPIILKGPLRDFFWRLLRPQDPVHLIMSEALQYHWTLLFAWTATASIIFTLTWVCADLYFRHVEEKSGAVSKRIESWVNAPKDGDAEANTAVPIIKRP
uniref:Acyltransferase 3 domain-containing protein n=1 Tax=Colletotrichum fructicola (strain Nara gc5) TaxID=1213859 RepID=L2FPP6_COLFN